MTFGEKTIVGISDVSINESRDSLYDGAVFASGFESRCVFYAKNHFEGSSSIHVFGFRESYELRTRKKSDLYFLKAFNIEPELSRGDSDNEILSYLNSLDNGKNKLHLLVDYTSMSRYWYGAILNWARFSRNYEAITIDFAYALGVYSSSDKNMVIKDIEVLPGFEGFGGGKKETVAIFGLGFEGDAALSVYDRLEPDTLLTYYSEPAANAQAQKKVLTVNKELINQSKANVGLPVRSVVEVLRGLDEILLPYTSKARITLVPMGPKPHILAALLLGVKNKNTTCLRVSGRAEKCQDVKASGEVVITRVKFSRNN